MIDTFTTEIPENIELNFVWHRGLRGHWTNQYSKEITDYIAEGGLINRVNLMSLGLKGTNWWNFSNIPHPDIDTTKEKEMILMLADEQKRGFKLGLQTFADINASTVDLNLGDYEQVINNANSMQVLWFEPWVEDVIEQTTGTVTFKRREKLLRWLNNQLKFLATGILLPTPYLCPVDKRLAIDIEPSLVGIAGTYRNTLNSQDKVSRVSKLLGEAKVSYIRYAMHWDEIEKNRNEYQWEFYDQTFKTFRDSGLKPLATLISTPKWASSNRDRTYPPNNLENWKTYVAEVVKRYGSGGKDLVGNWEIWNEPDINQFFKGSPEEYIDLLNSAYDVIKKEDPQAKVWAPSTVLIKDINADKFKFTQLAIEKGELDVFSIHVYGNVENSYKETQEIRERLNSYSKNSTPLALTETNLPGPYVNSQCPYSFMSEEEQAKLLTERYYCMANAGATSVFWYKVVDTKDDNCPDGINRNGVIKTSLSPKLAYYALKAIGESINFSNPSPTSTSIPVNPIVPSASRPTPPPHPCPEKANRGNYDCTNGISEDDFNKWRDDYKNGKTTLEYFEYFRRASFF